MKVCIGGTFNILHRGHKQLIQRAFHASDEQGSVFIGITDGKIIKQKKNIKPYLERKKNIEQFITDQGYMQKTVIKPISDKYGPTLEDDFDVIVVSPETKKTAVEINEKRVRKGKQPLIIIEIPYVLAEDNKPISSTRIMNNEIDENGAVL